MKNNKMRRRSTKKGSERQFFKGLLSVNMTILAFAFAKTQQFAVREREFSLMAIYFMK
jgi:hypothetical protein